MKDDLMGIWVPDTLVLLLGGTCSIHDNRGIGKNLPYYETSELPALLLAFFPLCDRLILTISE